MRVHARACMHIHVQEYVLKKEKEIQESVGFGIKGNMKLYDCIIISKIFSAFKNLSSLCMMTIME